MIIGIRPADLNEFRETLFLDSGMVTDAECRNALGRQGMTPAHAGHHSGIQEEPRGSV